MLRVMHVIDARTGAGSLDQLVLLSRESEPVVCVGPPPSCRGLEKKVRSIHLPITDRIGLTRSLRRRLDGAEIVHAWSPSAYPAARAIARQFRCPVVVSMPYFHPRHPPRGARNCLGEPGAHITVPTRVARDRLIGAGLPASTVGVLPPAAVACDGPAERRERTRRTLGLCESECLLVAPAPMTRGAGHRIASWAHAIVRQAVPHVRLLFPGTGPIEQHVRFFAGTTGYDAEVFFTRKRITRSDALAAADIGVFFFERDVGVSSLASAMAAGLAVAASATPDAAQCAPHEQAALLAEPGNPRSASAAILRLIEEPKLARRLGDAARDLARERFDTDKIRKRLDDIYAGAMSS